MATTINWNVPNSKIYESGVDRGVLFPRENSIYENGYAWEGLTGITESPGGSEPTDLYANNVKYATMRSAPTFGGTIEAYTYPPEWAACDGSADTLQAGVRVQQQTRQGFGLAYRTWLNSEGAGEQYAYRITLIYGATASPSEASRATINESPEAVTFSWEFTTDPVSVAGHAPTSVMEINSADCSAEFLTWLEEQLYGDGITTPRLPLPDEIIAWTPA